MKVSIGISKCYICGKRLEVPLIFLLSNDFQFYLNKVNKEIQFYQLKSNPKIEEIVSKQIDSNDNLIFENDDTKGGTFYRLLGELSDTNLIRFHGNIKCDRCKLSFYSKPKESTKFINILPLSF
jgi:hypothetical protein